MDEKKLKQRRIYTGLAWAERGYPFYVCVLKEKHSDKTKTFDDIIHSIEIIKEGEAKSFHELTNILKTLPNFHCNLVYAVLEPRFYSFIKDINLWKRTENVNISFRGTKSSSLEGSLLKIFDLLSEKQLIFREDSTIKEQLKRFAKINLTSDTDRFYAVKAVSFVIDAFTRAKRNENADEMPNQKGWW